MKTTYVLATGFALLCLMLPGVVSADTVSTLAIPPGAANPIDSFSTGLTSRGFGEFSFTLPISSFTDELFTDEALGTRIPTMILTATNTVTLVEEEFTFGNDVVTSFQNRFGSTGVPTASVTVVYETLQTDFTGGNPSASPEPSSLLVLAIGLLGLKAKSLRRRA